MSFQGPKSLIRERSSSPQGSHEHRIRHLMAIQVRSFTPFPVRDAVTSSLAVTGPPPSDCVDDMELILGRGKSRRISTNSLGTLRNLRTSSELIRSDQTPSSPTAETSPGRPRTNSRSIRKALPASYQHRPTRERAASSASIQSMAKLALNKPRTSLSAEDASPPSSPVLTLPEATELQSELEHVVASRLVETFLTLEIWTQEDNHNAPVSPFLGGLNSPVRSGDVSTRLRSGSASSRTTPPRSASFRPPTPSKVRSDDKQSRPASPGTLKRSTAKPRASSSAIAQSPRTKRTELSQSTNTNHALPTPAPSPPPGDIPILPPFYISAFHRPSTNPSFASLDSKHDFAEWADLGNHRFRAFLWGSGGSNWGKTADSKEKRGEDRNPLHLIIGGPEVPSPETDWDILASWDVDMDELVPLPAEFMSQPSLLPSNTLVVRLAPNADLYYLPGGQKNMSSFPVQPSRPPSPLAGYSDTEVSYTATGTIRRGRRRSSLSLRPDLVNKSLRETRMKKSAGFGDLLKLVTLQSVIADTRVQLDEIIESCDRLLEDNTSGYLQREVSQKQETIKSRTEEYRVMTTQSAERRLVLDEKRSQLTRRKRALEDAKKVLTKEQVMLQELREACRDNKQKHAALVSTTAPVRTTVLQTVATIFPIEPVEPRDLLFGILNIPLPIPTGTTDPAPPLTITSDSSYTEDTMASALGFVAQVVNLVAAYLGDAPVYPIVCQGSRSLIKDPISAMMGPRMFPLYARGVDTYRFEYGVFLLNKNIELLMAERNLQALDLRHTLPNLKNLLLTLTSGATIVLKPRTRRKASVTPSSAPPSVSAFTPPTPRSPSPSSAPSEQSSEDSSGQIEATLPTTPTASKIVLEPVDSDSEPSTTTSNAESTIKKTFYSPLASFLRARYPSVRTTPNTSAAGGPVNVRVEAEMPSTTEAAPTQEDVTGDVGDAAETSTIRGSIRGVSRRFFGDDVDSLVAE